MALLQKIYKITKKDKGEPLPHLPLVYFWQANVNLNLLIISFKGMFVEITKKKKNPDSITILTLTK